MQLKTLHSARHLAAVSYVPLIGLIVLYGHRHDRFVRFHALQGTFLSLYFLIAYFIPVYGVYLALLFLAMSASGFIYATRGLEFRVWGLGHFLAWIIK